VVSFLVVGWWFYASLASPASGGGQWPGLHLLLKASRGVALERLIPLLQEHLNTT